MENKNDVIEVLNKIVLGGNIKGELIVTKILNLEKVLNFRIETTNSVGNDAVLYLHFLVEKRKKADKVILNDNVVVELTKHS